MTDTTKYPFSAIGRLFAPSSYNNTSVEVRAPTCTDALVCTTALFLKTTFPSPDYILRVDMSGNMCASQIYCILYSIFQHSPPFNPVSNFELPFSVGRTSGGMPLVPTPSSVTVCM